MFQIEFASHYHAVGFVKTEKNRATAKSIRERLFAAGKTNKTNLLGLIISLKSI
jgi:hypothetical protein